MADGNKLDDWLSLAERFAAWSAVVCGAAVVWWRRGRQVVRGLWIASQLHSEFGDDAARQIRKLFDDLASARSIEEVRQTVAEKHLRIGIYICDPTGACTWSNEFLAESFGVDESKMRGYGWISAINENEQLVVHSRWVTSIENGLPYHAEYTVENKRTGQSWRAVTEARPLKRHGEVVSYVGWVTEKVESGVQ